MYEILYTAQARSAIEALPRKKKHQIRDTIERLGTDPSMGKLLTRELSAFWSCRSGDLRIIYRVIHERVIIIILAIGHRKNIYKQLKRREL